MINKKNNIFITDFKLINTINIILSSTKEQVFSFNNKIKNYLTTCRLPGPGKTTLIAILFRGDP